MAYTTFRSAKRRMPLVPFLITLLLPWVLFGLLDLTQGQLHDESFPSHPSDEENGKRLTREYRLKQGVVKGLVLEPRDGKGLDGVEVFLGIPYAGAPVGGMRFMPPGKIICMLFIHTYLHILPLSLRLKASLSCAMSYRFKQKVCKPLHFGFTSHSFMANGYYF